MTDETEGKRKRKGGDTIKERLVSKGGLIFKVNANGRCRYDRRWWGLQQMTENRSVNKNMTADGQWKLRRMRVVVKTEEDAGGGGGGVFPCWDFVLPALTFRFGIFNTLLLSMLFFTSSGWWAGKWVGRAWGGACWMSSFSSSALLCHGDVWVRRL